jgi:phosphatidylinositol 4-kinase
MQEKDQIIEGNIIAGFDDKLSKELLDRKKKSLLENDPFGETFESQCERIRVKSPFGELKTWRLTQLIVKKGCDLRQEQFAMQLISQFDQIFKAAKLNIWLRPYEIVCTGPNCGLIECIHDAISLDTLNKKLFKLQIRDLNEFFLLYYPNHKSTHCNV